MHALRPALWRQAQRATRRSPWLRRTQHDHHGPHKEYFQTPGQMPAPDTTPYTAPYTPRVVKPSSGPSTGASLFWRFARSVFWADLFFTLGALAGTALISWEYMQPPFEPGSEEDQELLEEIQETIEAHPVVEGLRQDNWTEENYYAGRMNGAVRGQHLIGEKLTGTRGITMKVFKHPSQPITMMVFFLGFGIEGWPDTVRRRRVRLRFLHRRLTAMQIHGGVIMSLLHESVHQHLQLHHPDLGLVRAQVTDVTFLRPMRPGDVYTIFVPPSNVKKTDDEHAKSVDVMPLLMHLDAPVMVEVSNDWEEKSDQQLQPQTKPAFDTMSRSTGLDRDTLKGIESVHAFGKFHVLAGDVSGNEDDVAGPGLF
ncbi:hypothetical protein PV05_05874 [Exophiala xenobiotica]|uniref:Thioesterase domain-containing protein n=1 Tax=Exophiala xenobiotica TaxID=348802 RepID=A0A0D2ERD1_9EURO|nr:uncharacterized protein PV05_05874 [Exophiala xenobiotica]KIW57305.1 hypothetical protein PV05_05874 [Exophiala xenobiotica]